jgi:hypothetical protein
LYSPKSTEPYLELAYTLLDQKRALSEQMSLLGTSASEMLAYDKLKVKMDDVLKRPFHTFKSKCNRTKNTIVRFIA